MADNPKADACKTYLDQTKLLVTLASAFIVAPAVLIEKLDVFDAVLVCMEVCFILSVFSGYVVFGSISGTQFKGDYDVYNSNTTLFSRVQISLFLMGVILLIIGLNCSLKKTPEKEIVLKDTIQECRTSDVNNIFFDFSMWQFRPESYYELNRLADLLTKDPNLKIEIDGHTDNIGSNYFNFSLSEKRAASVVQYLIHRGIAIHRIESKVYGETKPLTTNETYEGRQINRRVEFILKAH